MFNEVCRIRLMFMSSYGSMYTDAPFLDETCRELVRWKMWLLIVQFAIVVFGLNFYEIGDPENIVVRLVVKMVHTIGTDVITLIYSAMNFAVMLVALQFFRSINERLTDAVDVVRELLLFRRVADAKVQMHCNITDDIDRIAYLYDKVFDYANQANDVFAVPVVLTLINSFLFSLVAVRVDLSLL